MDCTAKDDFLRVTCRLQQQPNSGNMVRISSTGSSPSSQMPESTTPYGLKVDPYTLNPGSPYGEVQRPHTTHLSPPQVTSTMMNNGNEGSNRYRKSGYQNRNGKNGFHHSGPGENYLPSFNSAYDHSNGLVSLILMDFCQSISCSKHLFVIFTELF